MNDQDFKWKDIGVSPMQMFDFPIKFGKDFNEICIY